MTNRAHIHISEVTFCHFAVQNIQILINAHLFQNNGQFFFQHFTNTVFYCFPHNEVINMYISLLTNTINTTTPLLDFHWVPRKVIVDDNIGKLQVQTFATGICRNKNTGTGLKLLHGSISLVNAHATVQNRYRISSIHKQLLQISLRSNKFCKNNDLLCTILTQNSINLIQQRLYFCILILELCLFCKRDDLLQLLDFQLHIQRNRFKSILNTILDVQFVQVLFP